MAEVIRLPGATGDEEALADLAVMEITRRLARGTQIEQAAAEFVALVRTRKQAGWHKVPMAEFEQLAKLVEGR